MEEANFIEGIYNYCDRWCERCPLTARCRVYATEQVALADDSAGADPDNTAYWSHISDNFVEALRMLEELTTELGLDRAALAESDSELAAERSRVGKMDFISSAVAYQQAARVWLEENRQPLQEAAAAREVALALPQSEERLAEMEEAFTVISWYLFQIEVKLRRAQHHLERPLDGERPGAFDWEQANAAAKIALIGIERSIGAWHLLYQQLPDHQDILIGLMANLERTRNLTIGHFPDAPGFKRPGFDALPSFT